jgi:hypothetical protein
MKIRKRDRMSIYRRMLKVIYKLTPPFGFCIVLHLIGLPIYIIYDLPELLKFKPIVNYKDGSSYWFGPNDKKCRIKILETILKENEK